MKLLSLRIIAKKSRIQLQFSYNIVQGQGSGGASPSAMVSMPFSPKLISTPFNPGMLFFVSLKCLGKAELESLTLILPPEPCLLITTDALRPFHQEVYIY